MNRNPQVHALALAALIVCAQVVSAATSVDLQRRSIDQVNRQKAATSGLGRAATPSQPHTKILDMEPDSALTLLESSQDWAGRHYRYQQTFRGIPIFCKQIVVSEAANGNVRALFGNMVMGLSGDLPDVLVKVSGRQALSIAKRSWLGPRLTSMRMEDESAQKMIYIDGSGRAYMAYVVTYFAVMHTGDTTTQPIVVVDANTGRVIHQWEDQRTMMPPRR